MAETVDHQNNKNETSQAKTVLLQEYASWSDENNNLFKLISDSVCDDRICLVFSVGQGGECFTLYCPLSYPHYNDNFFVEGSSSFQIWLNCLNEFILDSEVTLSLSAILNKAAATYTMNRRMSVCSSTSESDSVCSYSSDKDNDVSDDDFEMSILLKRKRWRQKEAQLRAANKMPKTSDMFDGAVKDHPKQVFSNSAATGILTNDLVAIMESQKTTGINAEPVDDNIYLWSVFLSDFSNNSELHHDLKQLKLKYGYDHIELQLQFTMDLYPFYPPVVRVIRPRLLGFMMLRVACMDHLMLSQWNPARSMLSVLQEIKEFLGQWARLDVDNERNCIRKCPFGAYTALENHLLWLAFVTEVPSRTSAYLSTDKQPSNNVFSDLCNDKNFDLNHSKETDKQRGLFSQQGFPSGTGYSSYFQTGWDINSYVAAQQEKDKQIVIVLQKILLELRNMRLGVVPNFQENCSTFSSFELPAIRPEESAVTMEEEVISRSSTNFGKTENSAVSDLFLFEILEQSSLIPFLEIKLQVDTFLEMCQHIPVYHCVMEIIKEFALQPSLIPLLWTLQDQVQSLYTLVTTLQKKVGYILEKVNKTTANGNASHSNDCQSVVTEEESLAREMQEMSNVVQTAIENRDLCKEACNTKEMLEPIQQPAPGEVFKDRYVKALKDMQILSCNIEVEGARAHTFSDNFKKSLPPHASQVMRIAQEVAALSNSLPVDVASSIFVRTDDAKCTLLRALIIGPEGTPYSGGCFQFDIMFPYTYPNIPPLVRFYAKAYGLRRFNPNLYNCGTVCLSLLGTWPGPESEQWHKDTSTLLQVLISIQSLIFVAEPYFNEPGYEKRMGTSEGAKLSENYNEIVLLRTVQYAMVEQLRCPSSGFEDVVYTHFTLKKDRILEELENHQKRKFSPYLKVHIDELKKELKKLQEKYSVQKKTEP